MGREVWQFCYRVWGKKLANKIAGWLNSYGIIIYFSIPEFTHFIFPIIQVVYPPLDAEALVSTQPLSSFIEAEVLHQRSVTLFSHRLKQIGASDGR
jgi:hypothetical protein